MERYLERALLVSFPAIVVLVGAHAVGVPYALEAALLAILGGAVCLGLERLTGDRTALDLLAATLLTAGAVVGAILGVLPAGGIGVFPAGGTDPAWAFVPLAPGVVALYAARRERPGLELPVTFGFLR